MTTNQPTEQQQTYIKTIPSIQALLLHLEGKGRAQLSIKHIRRILLHLAKRADLNNPSEVELTIARYIK